MIELLKQYGSLAAWIVAGLVWVAAIWTVFSRGKFVKNAWLWALLSLVGFTIPIPLGDGAWLALRVPLGAIAVLLFAAFGPRTIRRAPLSLEG